jgi:hypothetical protein
MVEKKLSLMLSRLTDIQKKGILNKLLVDFPDYEFGFRGGRLTVNSEIVERNPIVREKLISNCLVRKPIIKAYSTEHCIYLCLFDIMEEKENKERNNG